LDIEENDSYREWPIGNYTLGQLQDRLFKILVEFDRICRKYNIRYILDSGTMLGAIRHNGFIPWDDDCDVGMLRSDYNKFMRALKKEQTPYVFESLENNKKYPYGFGKFKDPGTLYPEPGFEKVTKYNSLWLDIFPFDKTFRWSYKLQGRIGWVWQHVRWERSGISSPEKRRWYVKFLAKITPFWLINLQQNVAMRMFNWLPLPLVCKNCHPGKNKIPLSSSFYKDTIEHKFENGLFFVPREYDEWLRKRYSLYYLTFPPVNDRHPTHGGRTLTNIKL